MATTRRPSKQMLRLLDALSATPNQWRHGYDIIKETGLLSGTLYPLLMRMTDQGLSRRNGANRRNQAGRRAMPIG